MPNVQACVLTFAPISGTGVQTVTGVVDQNGSPFLGQVFIFQSAYAANNTVTSGNIAYPWYADMRGVDTGSIRSALGVSDCWSAFNAKFCSGFVSFGDYSLVDTWTSNIGTYVNYRLAKISAIRSGEFDITYDQNDRNGDIVLVLVLGGDGIDFTFFDTANDGTYTTASKPQGLLQVPVTPPLSSGSSLGGVGGQSISWGFSTRDGMYGTLGLNVCNQGENWSVQRVSAWSNSIDPVTGDLGALPTISAWTDTTFTIANGPGGLVPMAICGENILTAGGSFTQPSVTGPQIISTGIDARVMFFWSIGQDAATTVYSGSGQMNMGWATPTSQAGFWSGERKVGNTGPAGYGVRYLSNDSILRFGTPDSQSTTFHSAASVNDISQLGTATVDWTSTDGEPRQIIWFAIGEAIAPAPTPVYHTRDVVRRRLRRSPIVWAEKDGLQTRVRINLFAVDMQPGVGTSDAPNPQVMIRASKDGGFTWGNERLVSAGRVGEYFERLNTWQWGQGRDWVFEVACSDPVTWNLINAYIDAEGGTN